MLRPILSIKYMNDLDLGLISKMSKFADDTKIGINADSAEAVENLKADLKRIEEKSEK